MAISLASLQTGVSKEARIITIYGDGGVGKDTFASYAPNPVFIFTENSRGVLDITSWQAKSYEDVMDMTQTLIRENHNFKTVVYSTLDWFEPMIWNYLIRQQPTDEKGRPVTSVESYGYGKGVKYAIEYWNDFIALVNQLRVEKDMMIIFIAHSTIRKITPPDSDSYDSYTLKLQDSDKVSAKDKIVECSDAVLFANWRVALTDEKLGFGNSRNRGVGSGERIIYTEERPAYTAKNRFSLPAQIHVREKDWNDVWGILASHIPWFSQFTQTSAAKTILESAIDAVAADIVNAPKTAAQVIADAPIVPTFFNKAKQA